MPEVAIGELTGGRPAGVSTGTGYRLDRDGVHFARGVLGDLASTNFVSGADGDGWRLRPDGSGELNSITVNLANVRGTLTASHIDSDVRNVQVLYSRTLDLRSVNFPSTTTITLADDLRNYSVLEFATRNARSGIYYNLSCPVGSIPSSGTIWLGCIATNTNGHAMWLFVGAPSGSTRSLRLGSARQIDVGWVFEIIGVKNP